MATAYLEIAAVLDAVAPRLGVAVEQLYSRVRLHQLEEALDRPGQHINGVELYESLPEKLVAMAEALVTSRPFPRGNPAAAAVTMMMMAELNGFELRIEDDADAAALSRHLQTLASGRPDDLLAWVNAGLEAAAEPDDLDLNLFVAEPMTSPRSPRVARIVEILPEVALRAAALANLGLRPSMHIPSAWQVDDRDAVTIHDMDVNAFEHAAGLIVVEEQGSCGTGVNSSWAREAALPILLLHPRGGPAASPLLAGQPGLITVAEYRDDDGSLAVDLVDAFVAWFRDAGLYLADAERRRANTMFRMIGLQVALVQAWAQLDVTSRAVAAATARLAPRRVNALLQSLPALSSASGVELLGLGTALGVDVGRWLSSSPTVPARPTPATRRRLTQREREALLVAQARQGWSDVVVRALEQAATAERRSAVARRFRLDTVTGWEILHQRLFP